MVWRCDTLILSDLHLGSEVSRAEDALHLIQSIDFRQLVLLGDIFADLNFRRLTGAHWSFLSCIRKLSNPKRRRQVVWVEGNHDHGLSDVMSHLVGIPVYKRYVWEYEGLRHLAIHGHQFDRFINRNILLSRFFEQFYYGLQKIDSEHKWMSRRLERLSTRWMRLSEKVAEGALAYAIAGRADRIFCGHTHEAASIERGGVAYFNSGCWTDRQATYLTVDGEGVAVHEYRGYHSEYTSGGAVAHARDSGGGAGYRDPRKERGAIPAEAADLFVEAGLPAYGAYESVRC